MRRMPCKHKASVSTRLACRGDNDPLDILDIGSKMWTTGSIVRVKVLGVLAMIDAGETDWKVRMRDGMRGCSDCVGS